MLVTHYPWHLLCRTVLLWSAFLGIGLSFSIIGPTLMDLKDLVQVDIQEISWIVTTNSLGSLIGSVAVGAVMDTLARYQYLLLSLSCLMVGVSLATIPFSPSLIPLCTITFTQGLGIGVLNTGTMVLLLSLWRGYDSAPYMHTLHFMYGIGAFLAPVLAKPFLHGGNNSTLESQTTEGIKQLDLKLLYGAVGLFPCLLSLLFLTLFLSDLFRSAGAGYTQLQASTPPHVSEERRAETDSEPRSRTESLLVLFMSCFFFLFCGLETSVGTFLTTFAVHSQPEISRQDGSEVTAFYWGCYASVRGIAIFAAILLPPQIFMWSSFLLASSGSLCLSVFGGYSVLCLKVGASLVGAGLASVFSTGLLWLENQIKITNKIGSVLCISGYTGAKLFPLAMGQFVGVWPKSFAYSLFGVVIGCVTLFIMSNILAEKIEKQKQTRGFIAQQMQ